MQRTRNYSFLGSFRVHNIHNTVQLLDVCLSATITEQRHDGSYPPFYRELLISPVPTLTSVRSTISQQMSLTTWSCVDYENGDRLIRLFVNMCIALWRSFDGWGISGGGPGWAQQAQKTGERFHASGDDEVDVNFNFAFMAFLSRYFLRLN